mmetsp:Transcript_16391/g.39220  ORF Transcript_16391/g.39220 Transcript_16391/m.39220 type:complete len:212 (+) Transcript_16391:63-698(+)
MLHHAHTLVVSVIIMITGADAWSDGLGFARVRGPTRLWAEQNEGDVADVGSKHSGYNVLGTDLSCCCSNVGGSGIGTGFYRNGFCATGEMDMGRHTVCVRATDEFLEYSKSVGNDLSTPMPQYNFPGLNDGDVWCLCAQRWAQAYNAGKAPQLFLQSTHEKTLDFIPIDVLRAFAIDADEADAVMNKLNLQRNELNGLMGKEVGDGDDSFQ